MVFIYVSCKKYSGVMEFLFFIIGFLLGSLGGVTAMCLVQINRIGKEEGHGQAEHRD